MRYRFRPVPVWDDPLSDLFLAIEKKAPQDSGGGKCPLGWALLLASLGCTSSTR